MELRTESRVLTCVSVSQGQANAVFSFSCHPSECVSELISPSFAEMKQTSDSSRNCRATDLLSDDSDAAFSKSHVTVGNVKMWLILRSCFFKLFFYSSQHTGLTSMNKINIKYKK